MKSAVSFRDMVFFSVSGDNEAQDYWQCLYVYLSSLERVHMNIKWDLYLSEYLSATSRIQEWPPPLPVTAFPCPWGDGPCYTHISRLFITLRGPWYIFREVKENSCVRAPTSP